MSHSVFDESCIINIEKSSRCKQEIMGHFPIQQLRLAFPTTLFTDLTADTEYKSTCLFRFSSTTNILRVCYNHRSCIFVAQQYYHCFWLYIIAHVCCLVKPC